MNNALNTIQQKKEWISQILKSAYTHTWLNETDYKSFKEKLDNDIITIGVIGQMKSGKSTFLNSFVFGDIVLPVDDTPETASISIITYGEKKKATVEYYSFDEWNDILALALQSPDNKDFDETKAIKAAKELKTGSEKLTDINKYLGTTQDVDFSHLRDYVGKKGAYACITKAVNISYPIKWLKGVRIVDTPGINDPVVSREERTKQFLKEADAVVLLTPADTILDETDRTLLFNMVGNAGIGRVIIGINKMDLVHDSEPVSRTKERAIRAIRSACEKHDDSYVSRLLSGIEPLPFSSLMALLGRLPFSITKNEETLNWDYNRLCEAYNCSSSDELLDKSLALTLENAIVDTALNAREEVIYQKIMRFIKERAGYMLSKTETAMIAAEKKYNATLGDSVENDRMLEYYTDLKNRASKWRNEFREEMEYQMQLVIGKGCENINSAVHVFKYECIKLIKDHRKNRRRLYLRDKCYRLLTETLKSLQNKTSVELYKKCELFSNEYIDRLSYYIEKKENDEGIDLSDAKETIISSIKRKRPSSFGNINDGAWMYYDKHDIDSFIAEEGKDGKLSLEDAVMRFCKNITERGISDAVKRKIEEFLTLFDAVTNSEIIDKLQQAYDELSNSSLDRESLQAECKMQWESAQLQYSQQKETYEEFQRKLALL